MMRYLAPLLVLALVGCERPNGAPWFERKNPDVEEGIAALAASDAPRALRAFDAAAREHPSAPEVALDRGLALLAAGRIAEAKEAFLRATGEGASPTLRADAFYDLGLAHHRAADEAARTDAAAATRPDAPAADPSEVREAVQRELRDAIESYRRSLRIRPGFEDAAWNLEIALRRLREEEEREQQEQQQQQEQQDQQQQDQQQQDQQQQDQQQQDQQQQDQQQQDQQQPQDQQPGSEPQPQANDGSSSPTPNDPRQAGADRPNPSSGEERTPGRPQPSTPGRPADAAEGLDPSQRAVLDALDRNEGSLEEARARARAAAERRRPTQDW